MSLEQLSVLIRKATDMAGEMAEKSEYWFYREITWNLKDMQQDICKQKTTEKQDRIEAGIDE